MSLLDKKQAGLHENASTQINVPQDVADQIIQIGRKLIPDEHLAGEGRVEQSHVTVKYGVNPDENVLRQVLADKPSFLVQLGKIIVFPTSTNDDAGGSPVVIEVHGDEFEILHKAVMEAMGTLPDDNPYTPHITIAYVKPEEAQHYAGKDAFAGIEFEATAVALSPYDDDKQVEIPLVKTAAASVVTPELPEVALQVPQEEEQEPEQQDEEEIVRDEPATPAKPTRPTPKQKAPKAPLLNKQPKAPKKQIKPTETKSFKQWFGKSVVRDEDGQPMRVYHGTTHDFESFDLDRTNEENFYGKGFYFTSDTEDLGSNYATESGPDLTSRIENRAERIMQEWEDQWDDVKDDLGFSDLEYPNSRITQEDRENYLRVSDKAKLEARKELAGQSKGLSMPVYLSLQNPVYVQPKGGTHFEVEIDEDGEESGNGVVFYNALMRAAGGYSNGDAQEVWGELAENMEFTAYDFEKQVRNGNHYFEDGEGNLALGNLIADTYQEAGFDGIVQDASAEFGPKSKGRGMSMEWDTKHYILWDASKIKSAIGNSGKFDPANPNITAADEKTAAPMHDEGKTRTYYHGTDEEAAAQAILSGGIQPREITMPDKAKSRAMQAPVPDRVYLTDSMPYAAIYAMGGQSFGMGLSDQTKTNYTAEMWLKNNIAKGEYGYIFEVTGADLGGDVMPDEDSIGEALSWLITYERDVRRLKELETQPERYKGEKDGLKRGFEIVTEQPITKAPQSIQNQLLYMRNYLTPNQLHRIQEAATQAQVGKKLQKRLSPDVAKWLLDNGAHLAHQGAVFPTRCWRFSKKDALFTKDWKSLLQEVPVAKAKTANDDAMYDHFDGHNDVGAQVLQEYMQNYDNPSYRQKWDVIPAARYKKILNDYMDLGFVRDEAGIDSMADLIITNIHKVEVNNIISGHTQENPEDWAEGILDERLPEGYFDKDNDFMDDGAGQIRISDYAADKLSGEAIKLRGAKSTEEKLQIIQHIMDIIHQRSDIAAWFIQGGRSTLSQIYGKGKSASGSIHVWHGTDNPEPPTSGAIYLAEEYDDAAEYGANVFEAIITPKKLLVTPSPRTVRNDPPKLKKDLTYVLESAVKHYAGASGWDGDVDEFVKPDGIYYPVLQDFSSEIFSRMKERGYDGTYVEEPIASNHRSILIIDPTVIQWKTTKSAARTGVGDLGLAKKIMHELMPVLGVQLPDPELKIVNQPRAGWLGQDNWQIRYDPRKGMEWDETTTISLQKSILSDENTLRRIIAHELCHHAEALTTSLAEARKQKERSLGEWGFKAFSRWLRTNDHGPEWRKYTQKFNAKFGADFVTKNSDETYAEEEQELRPYSLLLKRDYDGKLAYEVSSRLTEKMKRQLDRMAQEKEEYRLTQTNDRRFFEGQLIGSFYWMHPKDENIQAGLEQLWENAKKLEPSGASKEQDDLLALMKKRMVGPGWDKRRGSLKEAGKRDEAITTMTVGVDAVDFPSPVLIRWEQGMRWRSVLKTVKSVVGEVAGKRVPWRDIHIWASLWETREEQESGWEQEKTKGTHVMYDVLHNGSFVSVGKQIAAESAVKYMYGLYTDSRGWLIRITKDAGNGEELIEHLHKPAAWDESRVRQFAENRLTQHQNSEHKQASTELPFTLRVAAKDLERTDHELMQKFMDEVGIKDKEISSNTTWKYMDTDKGRAGVNLIDTYDSKSNTVEIHWLTAQERGSGRAAMERLCQIADKHGVKLILWAVPLAGQGSNQGFTMTQKKLEQWYAEFGFKIEHREEQKPRYARMSRKPKKVTTASHKTPPLSDTQYENPEQGMETNAYALIPERVKGTQDIPALETLAPQLFEKEAFEEEAATATEFEKVLNSVRQRIASQAQVIYDEWQPGPDGDDDDLGSGGICTLIGREIQEVLAGLGIDSIEGGQEGDDHSWIVAYNETEAFGIDIPYTLYERGGGYSWIKVPNVQFRPTDVLVFPTEIDREGLDKYGAVETDEYTDFNALAAAQRGAPERAMLNIQHSPLAAGVYSYLVEHVGDLTHRMSEETATKWKTFGYEFVKPKVEKCLRMLENPFGFEREMEQNRENNFAYHEEKGKLSASFDEELAKLRALGKAYADAHAKLPVHNHMQDLARDAAVAAGLEDFDTCRRCLRELDEVLKAGQEAWAREAGAKMASKNAALEGVQYRVEVSDASKGELYCRAEAKIGDKLIGWVNFNEVEADIDTSDTRYYTEKTDEYNARYWERTQELPKEIWVKMVFVADAYRRKGIATGMYEAIKKEFPGERFISSGTTEDGTPFREKLKERGVIAFQNPLLNKNSAQRQVYFHGTSFKNLRPILTEGLVPEGKAKTWADDPSATISGPSKQTYGGVYLTRNLMTAIGAPRDEKSNPKYRMVIVAVEGQPNSMFLDEDSIVGYIDSPFGNMGQDSAEHLVGQYFLMTLSDAPQSMQRVYKEAEASYVQRTIVAMKSLLDQKELKLSPELDARLRELLPGMFLASLTRRVAHAYQSNPKQTERDGYDARNYDYKRTYSQIFGSDKEIPPKEQVIPPVDKAETQFRETAEQLTRTLRSLLRIQQSGGWQFQNARVTEPIGYKGSNHIICVLEIREGRDYLIPYPSPDNPEQINKMLPIVVHYGKVPPDFEQQWRERMGYKIYWLKPGQEPKMPELPQQQEKTGQYAEGQAMTQHSDHQTFGMSKVLNSNPFADELEALKGEENVELNPALDTAMRSEGQPTAKGEAGLNVNNKTNEVSNLGKITSLLKKKSAPQEPEIPKQPWEMKRDEYAPRPKIVKDEKGQDIYEEETDEQAKERYRRSRDWEQDSLGAMSLGKMTPEEAKERGYWTDVDKPSSFKPLPAKLYHVTTNASAIYSGGLKTRHELAMAQGGTGLGGGTDKAISFTTDLATASGIYRAIIEAIRVLNGKIPIQKLIEMAEKGEGADRPYINELMNWGGSHFVSYQENDPKRWTPGKPYDLHHQAFFEGKKIVQPGMGTADEEMPNGEPIGEGWKGGDGRTYHTTFKVPMTAEEKQGVTFDFFKTWLATRENAGGHLNPLFFSSNVPALANTPEEEVAILEFKPVPGASGTQESALGEWRVYTGKAVELVGTVPANVKIAANLNFKPLTWEQWLKKTPIYQPDDLVLDKERYEENVGHFSTIKFPLTIFRALEIEKGSKVNWERTGESWTWVENSADAYFGSSSMWGPEDGVEVKNPQLVLIKAQVQNSKDVDWQQTLYSNMLNPDENEVTIWSGANLKPLGVDYGKGYEKPTLQYVTAKKELPTLKTIGFGIEVPKEKRQKFFVRPNSTLEYWAFKNRPRVFVNEPVIFMFNGKPVAQAMVVKVEGPGHGEGEYKHWHKVYWKPSQFKKYRVASDRYPSEALLDQLAWEGRDMFCPHGEPGKCQDVSDYIVEELHKRGYDDAYTAHGQFRGEAAHPHAWVRVGNIEIDATQDQFATYFDDEDELMDQPVYIGQPRQWGHSRTAARKVFEQKLYRGQREMQAGRGYASDPGDFGRGIYWTSDIHRARAYGKVVEQVVRLENPIYLTEDQAYDLGEQDYGNLLHGENRMEKAENMTRDLLAKGYDGLVATAKDGHVEVVDYRPLKKSAADDYLYHVTLQRNVDDILEHGLKAELGGDFADDNPPSTFLTEKLGVKFWEQDYAQEYGEPTVVLKVPRKGLNLIPDEQGSHDAKAPAYRVEQDIPASLIKVAAMDKEVTKKPWGERQRFVLSEDGNELGWVEVNVEGETAYVNDAFLVEEMRGKGHGSTMYRHMLADLKTQGVKSLQTTRGGASPQAARVWESLKRDFKVEEIPSEGEKRNFRLHIADHFNEDGFWAGEGGGASGILAVCPRKGTVCLAWRSNDVNQGDCWGTIGGAIVRGMSPSQSAKVELQEEMGYHGGISLTPAFVFNSGSFQYHNFIGIVSNEFSMSPKPYTEEQIAQLQKDNAPEYMFNPGWETDHIAWVKYEEVLDDMQENASDYHVGLIALFQNSKAAIERALGIKPNEPKTSGSNCPSGKKKFFDATSAVGPQKQWDKGTPNLRAYKCPLCSWWHLTSKPQWTDEQKQRHGVTASWAKKAAGFMFKSFKKLWHVGTFNVKDKGNNSLEGAGLSVSIHPEDWSGIAGLGNEVWEMSKAGNKFVNFHSINPKQRQGITQWGIQNGYVEHVNVWRATWIDVEDDQERFSDYNTEQEAREEAAEMDGTARQVENELAGTVKLQQRSNNPGAKTTSLAFDLLVTIYAEDELDCDGVWWQDDYDPSNLSAPRGVIFPGKLSSWKKKKLNGFPVTGAVKAPQMMTFWHGTSAEAAKKIQVEGLKPDPYIWASLDDSTAYSYAEIASERAENHAEEFGESWANDGGAIITFKYDYNKTTPDPEYDGVDAEGNRRIKEAIPASALNVHFLGTVPQVTASKTARDPQWKRVPVTDEWINRAKLFLKDKWAERHTELGREGIPTDLAGACKFASLFAQKVFGGRLTGDASHQMVKLVNGRMLDLTDVYDPNTFRHDKEFWMNPEHEKSMKSCEPRVNEWVDEFMHLWWQEAFRQESFKEPVIQK